MEQQPLSPKWDDLLYWKYPAAAALLYQRYGERLVALAQRRLGERLRGKVDPEDVLQSVLRNFYSKHANGAWDIADESSLRRLLVRLTIRECNRHLQHFHTARRDVRREVVRADKALPAIDPEPTPDQAVLVADVIQTLMNRLDTEIKRRILELSLQGYSVVEISRQVGYYERGVERVRAVIRSLLRQIESGDRPT